MNMGLTAEYLATKYRIPRGKQDEFALRSHQLAAAATDRGEFQAEIVPTWGRDDAGRKVLLTEDQCIRRDTSLEALVGAAPGVQPRGRLGHGRQQLADQRRGGGAADHVGGEGPRAGPEADGEGPRHGRRRGRPRGDGHRPGARGPARRSTRAGLTLDQIDCIELNEAFAVQVLAVLKLLGIGEEKVNTRGGAIAIGHPLGASGARIATTLLHRMRDQGAKLGLATMCVGQGQGVATIFEACEG